MEQQREGGASCERLRRGTPVWVDGVHRFGSDALLLAAFCRLGAGQRACDLGSGCGIVSLCWHDAGHRGPCLAVELQPAAAALLQRALATPCEVPTGETAALAAQDPLAGQAQVAPMSPGAEAAASRPDKAPQAARDATGPFAAQEQAEQDPFAHAAHIVGVCADLRTLTAGPRRTLAQMAAGAQPPDRGPSAPAAVPTGAPAPPDGVTATRAGAVAVAPQSAGSSGAPLPPGAAAALAAAGLGSLWEGFDLVACNPPYFTGGRISPKPGRGTARHQLCCTLADVCTTAARLLRYGGRLCLCQRPTALPQVVAACLGAGLQPKRLQLVRCRPTARPWLLLLEARRGGKEGLLWLDDLVLQPDEPFSR